MAVQSIAVLSLIESLKNTSSFLLIWVQKRPNDDDAGDFFTNKKKCVKNVHQNNHPNEEPTENVENTETEIENKPSEIPDCWNI